MNEYQCPNCFGTTFYWFDDSSGIECKTCARFIPDEELEKIAINKDAPLPDYMNWNQDELISEIKRLAEECQNTKAELESLEHSLECHKNEIRGRDKKIANLHKVIEKQRLKIQRQTETITTLLHLYTSGKRCKAHKRLREKYRLLKASFTEWRR